MTIRRLTNFLSIVGTLLAITIAVSPQPAEAGKGSKTMSAKGIIHSIEDGTILFETTMNGIRRRRTGGTGS